MQPEHVHVCNYRVLGNQDTVSSSTETLDNASRFSRHFRLQADKRALTGRCQIPFDSLVPVNHCKIKKRSEVYSMSLVLRSSERTRETRILDS